MTNEQKAKDILSCKHCTLGEKICFAPNETPCVSYRDIIKMAQWKDEQFKDKIDVFEGQIAALEAHLKKAQEALVAMEWKDKERQELWRITRNHYQEWAIEQITAFAQHLNKRGAFRDDLCMDFEHEAQSFIEMQNNKEL